MKTPALKEWQVIVEALGAGAQTILLRKGGIAEGRQGFQVASAPFWLFPTQFHAQVAKTKPAAHAWFPAGEAVVPTTLPLRLFAEVVEHRFIREWPKVAALDPLHLWTEATVRERFQWSAPEGLHVMLIRVHRLTSPLEVDVTPALGGCKSWVEVPVSFRDLPAEPVLSETAFASAAAAVRQRW